MFYVIYIYIYIYNIDQWCNIVHFYIIISNVYALSSIVYEIITQIDNCKIEVTDTGRIDLSFPRIKTWLAKLMKSLGIIPTYFEERKITYHCRRIPIYMDWICIYWIYNI